MTQHTLARIDVHEAQKIRAERKEARSQINLHPTRNIGDHQTARGIGATGGEVASIRPHVILRAAVEIDRIPHRQIDVRREFVVDEFEFDAPERREHNFESLLAIAR